MAITERYVSTTASGGGAGTEGDPWTLVEAAASAVAGDRVNVKDDGTYNLSALSANFNPTNSGTQTQPVFWRGYGSTIGDLVRPTIVGTASYVSILGGTDHWFADIDFTNAASHAFQIDESAGAGRINCHRCSFVASTTTGYGFNTQDQGAIGPLNFVNCYFECGGNNIALYSRELTKLYACHAKHRGDGSIRHAIQIRERSTVVGCIIEGGPEYGLNLEADDAYVVGNTFYNIAGHGMRCGPGVIADNIFWDIGGYSFYSTASLQVMMQNNAMGQLTSGRTSGLGDLPEIDPIILTADPFVDAANGDFRLNDAAGGGRLCKFAGLEAPTS